MFSKLLCALGLHGGYPACRQCGKHNKMAR
jgi:hypothetical protein